MPGLLLNIDVPDVESGIAFYTAALGLKAGRRVSTCSMQDQVSGNREGSAE